MLQYKDTDAPCKYWY